MKKQMALSALRKVANNPGPGPPSKAEAVTPRLKTTIAALSPNVVSRDHRIHVQMAVNPSASKYAAQRGSRVPHRSNSMALRTRVVGIERKG